MDSDMSSFLKDLERELKTDLKYGDKEVGELFGFVADKKELERVANKLKEKLEYYIKYYFDNYHAKTANGYDWNYKGQSYHYGGRTGQLLDSVSIDIVPSPDGLSAKVFFDDSKSYRNSLWGGEDAYIPELLNDGYRVKSGWHKNIHHFGHFEGARFIEDESMEAKKDPLFEGVIIIYEPSGGYGMRL